MAKQAKKLTEKQIAHAERLYRQFFKKYPDQKNPTDPNTKEKFYFLMSLGWHNACIMQKARKQKLEFTKRAKVEK